MIVGKIWDSEYPWDVRVEKVCSALVGAGHRVHLVCRNRRDQPLRDEAHGATIHRMPFSHRLPGAVERASSFPAFVNPRWYSLAKKVFEQHDVDVILCRDLPLAPLALAVGRKLGKPVMVDVAEHYPAMLRDLYNRHDFRVQNLLIRNPYLASVVERLTLPAVDHVLVVVEESAERLVKLGVDPARITVVSNIPPTPERGASANGTEARASDGTLRLVYLGKIERSRGLDVVLEGLATLRGDTPRVTLDVFGDGMSLERHRREAEAKGLGERVTFHGHRPYQEVLDRLPTFDVGVIPHHATDQWNYTIQNKLFDYMAAGIPLLVSSMPPAARVLSETGAGVVFADRDAASFVQTLRQLEDGDARRRMGAAGRNAVRTRYNWDYYGARLLEAVERCVAAAGSARVVTA